MSEDQSYQSLKDAIEGGDLDKVKDLVENGNFDLNGPNLEENEKPLIQAVISQSPFLVEYLIEKGAKVDEAQEVLYTACKMACSYDRLNDENSSTDDLSIIRCLLENGADPSFEKLNETPLDVVCSSSEGGDEKRFEIIKVLVETGAYAERIEDPDLSPVLSTCDLGEWAIEYFKYFTEKFPSLLKSEEFKNRYLLDAAKERQFGLMEALLDVGADINAVDKHGNTPLLGFASANRVPVGHSFAKDTAFVECMRSLIEKGADPLHRSREMESTYTGRVRGGNNLFHAILEGMPTETERRIEFGYDTTGKGREFFKELLGKGVSANEKNKRVLGEGETAKEMLIEMTMVEWLDCLKEFEGGGGDVGGGSRCTFTAPAECVIAYQGTDTQEEYLNVYLKDSDEVEVTRVGTEKGSFTFTWMLPRSLQALLDALGKGTGWAHYFKNGYRGEKWDEDRPGIDFDECDWLGGNGLWPDDDEIWDENEKWVDPDLIDEYGQGGDTESIRFEPSDIHEITIRDEEGNWIRFDPMPNDYWKISQGTSKDSEKQPLDVDLVSGDEFDLIERVKEICENHSVERKIFLHRNGKLYGPYSRSSVERFLLESLASPNDWARFKGSKEWVRLEDILEG